MAKTKALEIIGFLLFAPIALGGFAAGLAFLGEAAFWLQYGNWPGWTLATELGAYPSPSGMVGFDKIIHWYFDLRISMAVFLAAAAWLCGVGIIAAFAD